jgi:hypothetical protein
MIRVTFKQEDGSYRQVDCKTVKAALAVMQTGAQRHLLKSQEDADGKLTITVERN